MDDLPNTLPPRLKRDHRKNARAGVPSPPPPAGFDSSHRPVLPTPIPAVLKPARRTIYLPIGIAAENLYQAYLMYGDMQTEHEVDMMRLAVEELMNTWSRARVKRKSTNHSSILLEVDDG